MGMWNHLLRRQQYSIFDVNGMKILKLDGSENSVVVRIVYNIYWKYLHLSNKTIKCLIFFFCFVFYPSNLHADYERTSVFQADPRA